MLPRGDFARTGSDNGNAKPPSGRELGRSAETQPEDGETRALLRANEQFAGLPGAGLDHAWRDPAALPHLPVGSGV